MIFRTILTLVAALFGPLEPGRAVAAHNPARVVSLDACADQYVLALTNREQIAALSPHATADHSHLRDHAVGLKQIKPTVEDILLLNPDVVVRTYGGEPGTTQKLKKLGIHVVQVPFANTIKGIIDAIGHVSAELSAHEKGQRLVNTLIEVGAGPNVTATKPTALYLTPSGYTTGPGTLVNEVIEKAGYTNFTRESGWREINLERLIADKPDLVITAFFESSQSFKGHWSLGRHPVLDRQLAGIPRVNIPGSLLSCSTWPIGDAIAMITAKVDAP